MKLKVFVYLLCFFAVFAAEAQAQNIYRYQIDLNAVKDDKLLVELTTPRLSQKVATFFMPKIIPGTYRNADYGRFVSQFSALDSKGKALPVKQATENSWEISNADKLAKISYYVEDTWESKIEHDVFDMAGTNIEEQKNYVINPFGFFGYFDGMKKLPFELTFKKPQGFYGSSPLTFASTNEQADVFRLDNADHLYDSPIMYSKPDTTSITLGKAQVLISSYSPKGMVSSKQIAELLKPLLVATQHYLGGKLPVNKYAFILYFNGEQPPLKGTGALEHNYSSFYALPEMPFQQIAPLLRDICAHEFFHVVTPLTISSKEVKEFDFNKPVLSRHLWLYEGSTEYYSDHVQVTEGLASPKEFLGKLSEKIKISRMNYNDQLSFTELSTESAGKHKEEYGNVYEKGALICAALDVYLLQLSQGAYGFRDLKQDLSIKFGKDQYFEDAKLFDVIAELTYPEVREFFKTYVEGTTPIPYEKFFGYAGVDFKNMKAPTLGGIQINPTADGKLAIIGIGSMNAQGKALGYQVGDELLSLNGEALTLQNGQQVLEKYKKTIHEGDPVEVKVKRNGEELVLKSKAIFMDVFGLELNPAPTPEQLVVRSAWLDLKGDVKQTSQPVQAKEADVKTIDGIVKALYEVISGPAGPRDWNRFKSLFYADAYMGAMSPTPSGELKLQKFTPEEYIKMNGPLFDQFAFNETELGRQENVFGNIAQVFTAYSFTVDMPTPMKERGVNSIQLIQENGRWYIMSIIWNDETKENPIPQKYLPAKAKK
jgi:predicted metalloprotease with PDZ domain